MVQSLGLVTNPGELLAQLRSSPGQHLSFSIVHDRAYVPGAPPITLHVFADAGLRCLITPDDALPGAVLRSAQQHGRQANITTIARQMNLKVIHLASPLRLQSRRIPKPWGAEIWYTGIEARGVCSIDDTPLPWLLAVAGNLCCGAASPILLKILDPFPDADYGDLYFEMHERKVEVYVVTHIDSRAWPTGTGAIRFGFDTARVAAFDTTTDFKHAYLEQVRQYRAVRVSIDRLLDEERKLAGIDPGMALAPAIIDEWKSRLPPQLIEQEQRHRKAMNAFTALQPLSRGDVVRVPPLTPHSLQHGVRVVEFQTPHYERYILSFAQKVLTQPEWDTDVAIDRVNWTAAFETGLPLLAKSNQYTVHGIADFDEFRVQKVSIDAGGRYRFQQDRYSIVMGLDGNGSINGVAVSPEGALLLPAALGDVDAAANSDSGFEFLVAFPK
jgi:hypothetical protein